MPTGVQLRDLVTELRAEVGHSLSAAHGVNMLDTLKHYIRRVQRNLWEQHNWPSLSLHARIATVVGQRYYAYPDALDYKRIENVAVQWGTIWTPVTQGITPVEYSIFDSQIGVGSDPIQKWDHVEYELLAEGETGNPNGTGTYELRHMMELWPIPVSVYQVRLKGRMQLLPLIEEDDVCTLDSDLIVLFAAALILARQKAEDAALVKADAIALLNRLKLQDNKDHIISLTGDGAGNTMPYGRPGIDFIP